MNAITNVGGKQFDDGFIDYFFEKMKAETSTFTRDICFSKPRVLFQFINFIHKYKHDLCLGVDDLYCDVGNFPNIDIDDITLSSNEYDKIVFNLVGPVERLLKDTCEGFTITKFCFCGSSSRIPSIKRAYQKFAKKYNNGVVSEIIQTDESVARGLCYWGMRDYSTTSIYRRVEVCDKGMVDGKEQSMFVEDVDVTDRVRELREEAEREMASVLNETKEREKVVSEYRKTMDECRELEAR